MEMDPLAVVLPQYALEEALAENEARHETERPLAAEARGADTASDAERQERSVLKPSAQQSPQATATGDTAPTSSPETVSFEDQPTP